MAELEVNGITLYYEEQGAGVAIACIHGGGSTAVMWEDALPELAQRGRAIAYDRRGCHRSERPDPYERTTVAEQAEDAAALLAALDAGPAIVIGRSYGGAVAVELTLRYPDQVRALALLEGDALGLSADALRWTSAIRDRLRGVAARSGVEAVYEAMIGELLGEGAWESFPEEIRQILSANGAALLAELEYVEEPMPKESGFASIAQPVLLVSASASPPEQRAMSEAMGRVLPNSRSHQVEGGHLIDPAAPGVLEFIDEVLGAG